MIQKEQSASTVRTFRPENTENKGYKVASSS